MRETMGRRAQSTPRGEVRTTQATVSLSFTDAQLTAIDAALTSWRRSSLAGLIGLINDERRTLMKMGSKSETFCLQTMSPLTQNPQLVSPSHYARRICDSHCANPAQPRARSRIRPLHRERHTPRLDCQTFCSERQPHGSTRRAFRSMCEPLRSTIRAKGSAGDVLFLASRALRSKRRASCVIVHIPRSTRRANVLKRRALRLPFDDPNANARARRRRVRTNRTAAQRTG
ncbi:MAG: hypothetical protein ACTHK2_14920 [Dokdonella sp.]|uniref:hypothetical protein n=1 Tax=Dokdonella sp. TaxID=2291710 RepID=UPI003F7EDB72